MLEIDDALPPRARGLFCNRTLNMRAIRAVGYDMDYTLIHYQTEAWERRAYEYLQSRLASLGWPVADLQFDPGLCIQGLIIDTELGNLLKANRFGYVKRAAHGTNMLEREDQRTAYGRTIIDLANPRFVFLNTLFSLSEAVMYSQCVDLLDAHRIPEVLGYVDLYHRIKYGLDEAHMEGKLKAEIIADPDRYVVLDPEAPLALLDQRQAGKKLILITNSEWGYTAAMMSYGFDRFLPAGMTWRNLFDIVIVGARKPEFFSTKSPLFEVVTEDGLLRPAPGGLRDGGWYLGGHAGLVEKHLGISGDEILYVGDHIFGDVHVSKSVLRWRTALILRELEDEIAATDAAYDDEVRLARLMAEKQHLEHLQCQLRLYVQRVRVNQRRAGIPGAEAMMNAAAASAASPAADATSIGAAVTPPAVDPTSLAVHAGPLAVNTISMPEAQERMARIRGEIEALDRIIAPLAKAAVEIENPRWGLLLRAGNDKSHLARQVERSADIYTSRVSNFLLHTPFVYLRSPRGTLPHDRSATLGP
jgi:HAD superfamily 5'-nucleotidase-like hydrolase